MVVRFIKFVQSLVHNQNDKKLLWELIFQENDGESVPLFHFIVALTFLTDESEWLPL